MLVDVQGDYLHVGAIFPFFDALNVSVPIIWYPVPLTTPALPYASPFVQRNWDIRDGLPQTPIGTVQGAYAPWNYDYPVGLPLTPSGTADQWANGVSYASYLAGEYTSGSCPPQAIYYSPCDQVLPVQWQLVVAFGSGGSLSPGVSTQGLAPLGDGLWGWSYALTGRTVIGGHVHFWPAPVLLWLDTSYVWHVSICGQELGVPVPPCPLTAVNGVGAYQNSLGDTLFAHLNFTPAS